MIVTGSIYNVCYFVKETNKKFEATFKYRFPDQTTYPKRIQRTFSGDKRRAYSLANEMAKNISNGNLPETKEQIQKNDEKYYEISKYILKIFIPINLAGKSPNTIRAFETLAKKEYLNKVNIYEFSSANLERFKLSLTEKTENSRATYLSYLRTVLKFAKKMGHRDTDIDISVKFFDTKARAMTTDEIMSVMLLASSAGLYTELLFRFGLELGLRLGERVGVSWDDIDLSKAVINLSRQRTADDKIIPLKNRGKNNINQLPIPDSILNLLKNIPIDKRNGFVLKMNYNHAKKVIINIHKKAGLPSHLQSHSHRHTFCSILANSGINHALAMSLSRHTSFQVFQKYVTISSNDKRNALNLIKIA